MTALAWLPGALAQPPGLSPEWETRKMLAALAAQAQRLPPLLEQVRPQEWVAHGAPETYVAQWKSTQTEVGYLVRTATTLSERPERLTLALETLFRMQALEAFLNSLAEGVRRYQNPALADLLQGLMGENAANRERLRQYVIDLAAVREQEFEVADHEAQRCRAFLLRQPPAPARGAARGDKAGERK